MVVEIVWYNLAWFIAFVLCGIVCGIVWEWNRKVALLAFVLFAVFMVASIVCVVISTNETGCGVAFSGARQWYYFIGSMCGGMAWTTMFAIGKNTYINAVI